MEGVGRGEAGSSSSPGATKDPSAASGGSNGEAGEEKEKKRGIDEEEVLDGRGGDDDHGDDDNDEEVVTDREDGVDGFVPGPLISLKEQLEKDKDDESLRRWKEKLLGCIDGELNAGQMDPEVIFHSIGIVSEGCAEIVRPLPIVENQSRVLFTLKEGSQYRLKLTFSVKHNIVSGLAYVNRVWKKGLRVDESKGMLGTFAPQRAPYEHLLEEETTPSGVLARGNYSAKLKFEDDDKRCHLELDYSFEIKKR
ncbi:rho GDP-dissociation inhibitor 1-like isoform X1 [Ananas comosus]|uniref:Rho GDP-dissociation inhibitor 1-like isoform X1 n=1 Tax=Ananas comosus TaxID=4615 RepID=A0A6P5H4A9_ANACO|nr:rho GDP-dissociation inhibitor 1-like isoform X1 [Ananas comosus]